MSSERRYVAGGRGGTSVRHRPEGLAGRWQPTLNRAAVIIGVLGLLSALLAFFVVSEGFTPEIGAYLVLVGMIVALAGVVTIAVAKK
ncbi:hypothetical protein [Gordonia sp. VNK21]|uniref:hypothetical protein n=1 Tax=Gordonia sp. VNK21 TaxID=3382483 RepID=UPI0038D4F508